MTNRKAVLQRTKVTFKLVCFMLAVYMTITQILRYFENNDASYIVFRQFNERHIDNYPTFTFCLYQYRGGSYSDTVNELHLTKEQYSYLLKGGIYSTNKSADKFKKMLKYVFLYN